TSATAPTVEITAPETAAPAISVAATVIKSGNGKTDIVAKDGEATAPARDGKDSKQAADPPARPVPDQAIKPETGAATTGDKPEQLQQATPDSTKAETEKHTGKAAPQAEHHAAAPTPQQTLLTDPGLLPPAGIQPQPIQSHAANLTAVPVTPANTALADSVPVPLNGLAADIALRAAGGNSRFEIRLDPAELGRIDVRLDVDKHGNVTSHLTVERPATLDMLRRDAPQLQQALEDAGLKTGDSGLQFSLRDQSSSSRDSDNGSGRNSQRVVITEEDTVPAQVAGRTYGRMLGASSGVDIRI
ncbi:MAG TPA: flagellar hook-length control protein FliK, partial [Afipia sp.]